MSAFRWKAAARGVVWAAAAVLGLAQSAQAALYVGNYDPAYGGTLGGIGYKGSATFYIPDSCLSVFGAGHLDNFLYRNNACVGGDYMRMDSAHVDLYRLSDNHVLGTVVYAPVAYGPLNTDVFGLYLERLTAGSATGKVTGVNALLGPQVVALTGTPEAEQALIASKAFYLQFGVFGFGDEGESYYGGLGVPDGSNPPGSNDFRDPVHGPGPGVWKQVAMYMADANCVSISPASCTLDTSTASLPAPLVFVPEPGSLALVLGALVAGWSLRRKPG